MSGWIQAAMQQNTIADDQTFFDACGPKPDY